MNLYECSPPCLLYPLRFASSYLSFSLFLSLFFPSSLVLYSLSLHRSHLKKNVFSNSFFVPTPMLVCSLVKRNGQTMSLTPQDLWNLCYGTRSWLLLVCNTSTIPLSLRFHYWERGFVFWDCFLG